MLSKIRVQYLRENGAGSCEVKKGAGERSNTVVLSNRQEKDG